MRLETLSLPISVGIFGDTQCNNVLPMSAIVTNEGSLGISDIAW